MASPITVIINASARQADQDELSQRLAQVFASKGAVDAQIAIARSGREVAELARRAAKDKSRVVVAGGGDGTINAVAGELVGAEKPLGILPLGTLNHFAKDLKVPLEIEAAAQTIIEGRVISVDAGEVNGRFFLNNSSLGIYPKMVEEREEQQERGRSKPLALLSAAITMLHRYPVLSLRFKTDDQEVARRTSIVFVGNNEYELEGLKMGTRKCLDRGLLHVYVMRHTGIWGLIRLFFSALSGKLGTVKGFDAVCVKELRVEASRKRVSVAIDGEVTLMETPLHYRIRPAALRVIVPDEPEVRDQKSDVRKRNQHP